MPEPRTSTKAAPRVSVCIASYNHAEFLPDMLDSVLAQSYKDFEVILVDDGSTDDSLEILNRYAERDPRLKVYTHPNRENRGISATFNSAIERSSGELISFIGSDDVWLPRLMELQVAEFEKDASVGLAYARAHYISRDGELLKGTMGKDITRRRSPMESIIEANVMPALTVMVSRKCFDDVGLFKENLVFSDWELWVRILSRYKPAFIDRPLARYRIHDANTSIGIGVPAEKIRENSRAVLLTIRDEAKTLGPSEAAIHKAVDRGLFNVEKRVANIYIDSYFRGFYNGGRDTAQLRRAWNVSPTEVCRPRRLAAIIKSFIKRI